MANGIVAQHVKKAAKFMFLFLALSGYYLGQVFKVFAYSRPLALAWRNSDDLERYTQRKKTDRIIFLEVNAYDY